MSQKNRRVKPQLLGGFRDYVPEIMISRQRIIDDIRCTFERFGFTPLDTPCLERSSVLGTDQDEFKMEVYRFMAGDQDISLRFDLTVPLSRVIAAYPEIPKPFKRYQFGNVWRKERPQAGRFREFAQFDADIVGSSSILADTEVIVLMYETLRSLGLDNFLIRFNNRKILNGLPVVCDFPSEKINDVLRILDKLEKIGIEDVFQELRQISDLSDKSVTKIEEFLQINGDDEKLLARLKVFFAGVEIAEEGISECNQIIKNLNDLNVDSSFRKFDLSIARGLGYYTGPVFETTLTDLPEIGSVFSGGRYDELVMRFTGEKIPSVGASVGVDRLIAALERLGKIEHRNSTSRVLLTIIDEKFSSNIQSLAKELRSAGINTEIYLGDSLGVKNQLIYAAKRDIPFVVFWGEEENKAGKIKLKDMTRRTEELLTRDGLLAKFLQV
ncbi:MAG: histidine--tRNA ligase [Candidatus Moranbacteria bacterium]|nr:histidine--tRNA ligase [Candidatus Moranbacteria bacterium]